MTDNIENTQNPNGAAAEPGKIQDHFDLFHNQEYQDLFDYKRQFEGLTAKKKKLLKSPNGPRAGNIAKRTLPAKP